MAKAKAEVAKAKVPDSIDTHVRITYGKGKKAVHVDVPVNIKFSDIWEANTDDKENLNRHVDEEVIQNIDVSVKLVDGAALKAFKAHLKAAEDKGAQ